MVSKDEYRYRCPKGHVTVRRIKNDIMRRGKGVEDEKKYRCNTCKRSYKGEPIDMLKK